MFFVLSPAPEKKKNRSTQSNKTESGDFYVVHVPADRGRLGVERRSGFLALFSFVSLNKTPRPQAQRKAQVTQGHPMAGSVLRSPTALPAPLEKTQPEAPKGTKRIAETSVLCMLGSWVGVGGRSAFLALFLFVSSNKLRNAPA